MVLLRMQRQRRAVSHIAILHRPGELLLLATCCSRRSPIADCHLEPAARWIVRIGRLEEASWRAIYEVFLVLITSARSGNIKHQLTAFQDIADRMTPGFSEETGQ